MLGIGLATPVLEIGNPTPVLEIDDPTPVLEIGYPTPVLEIDDYHPCRGNGFSHPALGIDGPTPVWDLDRSSCIRGIFPPLYWKGIAHLALEMDGFTLALETNDPTLSWK